MQEDQGAMGTAPEVDAPRQQSVRHRHFGHGFTLPTHGAGAQRFSAEGLGHGADTSRPPRFRNCDRILVHEGTILDLESRSGGGP
jgi:hypothetical protein